MRKTIKEISKLKANNEKISVLTCYTANYAKILDNYCDILLVGDSLGMVLYGYPSTLQVSLDMMINHGKAVVNSSKNSLVVVDMPFATYQESKEQAFRNAAKILQETNCGAVKLEGGSEMVETIKFLTERGIPVMAHIGLKPQHFNQYGGYNIQGKDKNSENSIIADIEKINNSGAFSVVIEGVKKSLADKICKISKIPVIGIGASENCDGQVLVTEDMLGFFDETPKFVKKYSNIKEVISNAVKKYSSEVKSQKFPTKENLY